MIRRIFASGSQTVSQASRLLALTAVVSNVLGLLRNVVFYRFLEFDLLDTYFTSFRIPDFFFNTLILSAIATAFVPKIAELLSHDREEKAWEVTNQAFTWVTVSFLVLILVLTTAMRPILGVIAHGFEPAKFDLTVTMARIIVWQCLLFAWSFICGGLLNGFRRFRTYALAPLLYNVSLIIGGFLAAQFGITALAWSVLVGASLHCLIQFREAWQLGFRPRFDFRVSPALSEITQLMLPRSLSQATLQFVLLSYQSIGSSLPSGSLTVFWGMNDLQTTPTVIVANSLATASLPALAQTIADGEREKTSQLLSNAIRMLLFVLLPTVVLGFVLRAQVVRLYIGLGSANWDQTIAGVHTFAWFMVSIIPTALATILVRVFYAAKNARLPLVATLLASVLAVGVAAGAVFGLRIDIAGLAMAETVAALTLCTFYAVALHRSQLVSFQVRDVVEPLLSFGFGALLAGFAAWRTLHIVDAVFRVTAVGSTHYVTGLLSQALAAIAVGLLVYGVYSALYCQAEVRFLMRRVVR